VIMLLNRRGYSFTCDVPELRREDGVRELRDLDDVSQAGGRARNGDLHARQGQRLECHYCGFRRGVPKTCPKCESEHLYFLGAGSQQGEEKLQELFPNARIGRMDRDTVRGRGDMERLLARLHSGEINLLVGTQMIAKGHDIHGVTLVGVVGADFALGLPDFRAAERVFQLLTQVSGRRGARRAAGEGAGADVSSGPLCDEVCGGARLHGLCREGDAVPALDALSAVCGAGECDDAEREDGRGGGLGGALGRWFERTRRLGCGCWGRRRRRSCG
jgi:hypothetical protein